MPVLDEAEDPVPPETVSVDRIGDAQRRGAGADDQHGAVVEAVRAHVARGQAQRELLAEQEQAGEDGEEERPEAADPVGAQDPLVPSRQVEDQREEDGAARADAQDRPGLVEERHRAVRAVAPRAEQQPAPDHQREREQRQVVAQRIEMAGKGLRRHPRQHRVAQTVRGDEGGGDQRYFESEDRDRENAGSFFEHEFYCESTENLIRDTYSNVRALPAVYAYPA